MLFNFMIRASIRFIHTNRKYKAKIRRKKIEDYEKGKIIKSI